LLEFDVEIKDKKGIENVITDHLSQLVKEDVTCNKGIFMRHFQMKSLCSFNKDRGLVIWQILKLLEFFQKN